MRVRHISLTNFRMYARLELDLADGLTIIQGDNAQGKTSLLEALYFLATSHSMHTATDRQVLRWGAADESPYPFVMLKASVQRSDGAHALEIAMQTGDSLRVKKEIRIDHAPKRGVDLVGQLAVVLFLPNDVELVSGAPALRRAFLDDALSQVDADYVRHLDKYNKALSQRNALLRQGQERRLDSDELEVWNEPVVKHGVQIAIRRRAAVAELASVAQPIHRELSNATEWLELMYQPNFDPAAPQGVRDPHQIALDVGRIPDGLTTADLEQVYLAALHDRHQEQIARGATLIGPHRDDLRFIANGMDVGEYGSRGQQRTSILSLKLAQAQWMRSELGEEPLLLLDEVLAELDPHRRRQLLSHIGDNAQTLVTTTDINRFDATFVQRANLLGVKSGIVHNL